MISAKATCTTSPPVSKLIDRYKPFEMASLKRSYSQTAPSISSSDGKPVNPEPRKKQRKQRGTVLQGNHRLPADLRPWIPLSQFGISLLDQDFYDMIKEIIETFSNKDSPEEPSAACDNFTLIKDMMYKQFLTKKRKLATEKIDAAVSCDESLLPRLEKAASQVAERSLEVNELYLLLAVREARNIENTNYQGRTSSVAFPEDPSITMRTSPTSSNNTVRSGTVSVHKRTLCETVLIENTGVTASSRDTKSVRTNGELLSDPSYRSSTSGPANAITNELARMRYMEL